MTYRLFFIRVFFCILLIYSGPAVLFLPRDVSANSPITPQKSDAVKEKEYDDAVVCLVDASSGMLGVEIEDEKTHVKQKLSFSVDASEVYVTNTLNQNLELSNVKPGDHVDLTVSVSADGKEKVTEINDFNQFEDN